MNDWRKRPYKRKRVARATLSEGGVGGSHVVMRPAPLPPPQEIKYHDSNGTNVVTGTGWTIINSASLYGIIVGGLANQRIGKNIRVVGVIFRGTVDTGSTSGIPSPWTIDLLQDKQCNGVVSTVGEIYTSPTNGNSLPNPLYDSRFKFLKRSKNNDPQSSLNQIDFNLKTNILVEYKDSTPSNGVITDLSATNLYLTMTSPLDTSSNVSYVMRVLYVDA